MGGVNLDDVEPGLIGAQGGSAEGIADGGDTSVVELVWLRIIRSEGNGAWREDVGPATVRGPDDAFATARSPGAGFASGVGELNAGVGALRVQEGGDAGERRDVLVLPQTKVLRADTGFGATAVASVKTSPAPPTARLPRWTRCQSLAKPSSQEYSHIGETTMRLESVTEPICRGEKRLAGF